MRDDPDKFRAFLLKRPELLDKLLDVDRKFQLAEKARQDSVEGLQGVLRVIAWLSPPPHIVKEIEVIYKAHDEGWGQLCLRGVVRGSRSVSR